MIVTRRTSRHFSRKPILRVCTIGALLLSLIALGSSPGSTIQTIELVEP